MQFAAALSEHPVAATAVGEVVGDILEHIGAKPDLLMVFGSVSHAGAFEDIAPALQRLLEPKVMVGCLAEGVIGPSQEVLSAPALSLWAARGCETAPFHLELFDLTAHDELDAAAFDGSTIVMLVDPRSYSPEPFFERLNASDKHVKVVGGFAGVRNNFGPDALIYNGRLLGSGAVAAVLKPESGTSIDSVVAQGARPIGSPLVVTKSSGKTIDELAGMSALQRLTEMLKAEVDDDDLGLAGEGLLIGRVVDERQEKFGIGDFIVRDVVDTDPLTGSITVSDVFDVGSVVQFHVRDERAANVALTKSLSGRRAQGALMFGSTSRGDDLFDAANNDAIAVSDLLQNPPLAGLMSSGEFGPLGGVNVVNGLSASLALFSRSYG